MYASQSVPAVHITSCVLELFSEACVSDFQTLVIVMPESRIYAHMAGNDVSERFNVDEIHALIRQLGVQGHVQLQAARSERFVQESTVTVRQISLHISHCAVAAALTTTTALQIE